MIKYMLTCLCIVSAGVVACGTDAGTKDPIIIQPPGTSNGNDGNDGANGNNGTAGQNGSNGKDGQGTAGNNGVNGKDGTDNKIIRTWKCDFKRNPVSFVLFSSGVSCSGAIDFWYYAQETTTGDTFVRAGIDVFNPSRTNGFGNSSSEFWAAGSWEAQNGSDWLLEDAYCSGVGVQANTGNWEFILNKASNHLVVNYVDADFVGGKFAFDTYCQ